MNVYKNNVIQKITKKLFYSCSLLIRKTRNLDCKKIHLEQVRDFYELGMDHADQPVKYYESDDLYFRYWGVCSPSEIREFFNSWHNIMKISFDINDLHWQDTGQISPRSIITDDSDDDVSCDINDFHCLTGHWPDQSTEHHNRRQWWWCVMWY